MNAAEIIDFIMKWLVVPVGVFCWRMWTDISAHKTEIALLRTEVMHARNQRLEDVAAVKDDLSDLKSRLGRVDDKIDKLIGRG